MITEEQIEAGCEIWLACWDGRAMLSIYNDVDRWIVADRLDYFTSRYEAELYLLECKLNDN